MNERPGEPADAALSGDVARFTAYLRANGKDFLVLEQSETHAHVRFVGRLLGEDVVWDCGFVTLREIRRSSDTPDDGRPARALRNFIDVGQPGACGVPIRVGLDIARIDTPAILKMIVMIRNYKPLKPGRHEFGTPAASREP